MMLTDQPDHGKHDRRNLYALISVVAAIPVILLVAVIVLATMRG